MTSTPLIGASALFNSMNSRPPATPAPTPVKPEISLKRSGFEAFSSTSSPFATAAKRSKSPPPSVFGSRSKSPVPGSHHHPLRAASSNAFTAYASGGAYAFSRSAARQGSGSSTPALTDNGDAGANGETSTGPGSEEETQKDEGPSVPESEKESFSARLRAQKDDDEDVEGDKKMNLTEQECEFSSSSVFAVVMLRYVNSAHRRGGRDYRLPSAWQAVCLERRQLVEGARNRPAEAQRSTGGWHHHASVYVIPFFVICVRALTSAFTQ